MRFHSAYRPVPSAMRVVVTGVVGIVLAAGMITSGTRHAYASEPTVLPVAGSKASPATGNVARPYEQGTPVEQLPQEAVGIEVVEKLGDSVPRDLRFVDADGREVTIGDLLDGNLPVILTFNYSSCPMLCSAQLRALTESMGKIPLTAGMQYRMVTIGLSPHETPQTAADTKARYIETFPEDKRETIAAGWRFLSGEERAIKAMADAVGLRYRYIEETGEYSHPASLVFLSPTGIITRYYHGISYEPEILGASIFQAGAGEYGVSVGFLLACFSPGEHKSYARAGERAMRYGATGFVVFMLAAFGLWQWTRTRKARQE